MREAARVVEELDLVSVEGRARLLHGIPDWFTKEISVAATPHEQLHIDMRALNNAARLAGLDRHPFAVWLGNAAQAGSDTAQAQVLSALAEAVESRATDEVEGAEGTSVLWYIIGIVVLGGVGLLAFTLLR